MAFARKRLRAPGGNIERSMKLHFPIKDLLNVVTRNRESFLSPIKGMEFPTIQRNFSAATSLSDCASVTTGHLITKRVYDVFFSACGLLLLAPLMAVIAGVVKIADRGDILYRQTRVGLGGREFTLYKFRTMVSAAD